MPANFRSYEGQLRLLTAVVAAHPELKLNYKGKSNVISLFSYAIFLHLALACPSIASSFLFLFLSPFPSFCPPSLPALSTIIQSQGQF